MKKRKDKLLEPAKINAPISLTAPDRLKLSMQSYRLENKQLKNEIERLQKELQKSSVR